MTRVIERCPSCGVEHDVQADGCEACGSALRWWCRAHSREIGWLETAECRRCAEDEARRMPWRRGSAAASPPAAVPRSEAEPPTEGQPSHEAAPPPGPPPPPPSSVTPYWCTLHGPEIGFLATPVCPRCAEAAPATPPAPPPPPPAASPRRGRRTMAAPAPPPVTAAPVPARPAAEPPPRPAVDASLALREDAPVATRGDAKAPAAATKRPGVLLRLFETVLSLLWNGIVWALLGVVAGGVFALARGGDVPVTAGVWGTLAAMGAVAVGLVRSIWPYIFGWKPPE